MVEERGGGWLRPADSAVVVLVVVAAVAEAVVAPASRVAVSSRTRSRGVRPPSSSG